MLEAEIIDILNEGSKAQLLALHGIGKKRADLILQVGIYVCMEMDNGEADMIVSPGVYVCMYVQLRETHGPNPFQALSDLHLVSPSTLLCSSLLLLLIIRTEPHTHY